MASKIKLRADQVVERKDGNVRWISDEGELNTNTEAEVSVGVAPGAPETTSAAPAEKPKADKPQKPAKPSAPAKTSSKPAPAPKPAAKPVVAAPAPVSGKKQSTEKVATAPSKPQEKTVAKAKKKSTAKGVRTIAGKEVDLSKYSKAKSAAGGASLNNGDSVAKKLEGKTIDEVYKIVAKDVKIPEADLRKKFKHLNPGMQRMNLGNMARKGPREEKPVKKAA